MKYVVLVSHGTFSVGVQSVLSMLAGGDRDDVIAVGLEDGMSADTFASNFQKATEAITGEDEVILMGDIVGGSPLTNALEQLTAKGLLEKTIVFGGMNLAMALTALLQKDVLDADMLKQNILDEAKDAVKEFVLTPQNEEEDDI